MHFSNYFSFSMPFKYVLTYYISLPFSLLKELFEMQMFKSLVPISLATGFVQP